MERTSLFDPTVMAAMRARVERLAPDAPRQWGSMTAAQMLAHCAEVQEVMLGKELRGTPFYIRWLGPLVRRMVVSTKPYPRNLGTHPQYVVSDPKDFAEQKARLLAALDRLENQGPSEGRHPIFGRMTADERGWSSWKHLDHHLRQFGG